MLLMDGGFTPTKQGWRRGRESPTPPKVTRSTERRACPRRTGKSMCLARRIPPCRTFRPSTFSTLIGWNGWNRMERLQTLTLPPPSRRSFTRSGRAVWWFWTTNTSTWPKGIIRGTATFTTNLCICKTVRCWRTKAWLSGCHPTSMENISPTWQPYSMFITELKERSHRRIGSLPCSRGFG